jgi:hypothetical protein
MYRGGAVMSNNKQQTAVEWYAHRLYEIEIAYNQGVIDTEVYAKSKTHALEQAKEMEKEEIKEAREDGHTSTYTEYDSDTKLYLEGRHEQYYNETYGGNK